MKLTDPDYKRLKKDLDISEFIKHLKDAIGSDKEEMKREMREVRKSVGEFSDSQINLLKQLSSDEFIMTFLGVSKKVVNDLLIRIYSLQKWSKMIFRERIVDRTEINRALVHIFLRLRERGINNQSKRIDFVIMLYIEYDLESFRTKSDQYELEISVEELEFRDRLRKLDDKAPSLNPKF